MDRPILFSGPMVRALLDGRKTQTRRVLSNDKFASLFNGTWSDDYVLDPGNQSWREAEIRFAAGDRLWVREAWRTHVGSDDAAPRDISPELLVQYEASGPSFGDGLSGKVRPSMFMPRWASRLTLTATDVRVQRLQDISEEDAQAEGVERVPYDGSNPEYLGQYGYRDYRDHPHSVVPFILAQSSFQTLWDSINAARGFGWDTNPWVVAVSFTVERRNIDQVAP